MSNNVKFSENGFKVWKKEIFVLLQLLYSTHTFTLLCILIQQLCELAIWYSHDINDARKLNINDLKCKLNDNDWDTYCQELYYVRSVTTHAIYKMYGLRDKLTWLLTLPYFMTLLTLLFTPEEVSKFKPLISSYALYMYTEDFEENWELVKSHLKD